MAKPAKPNKLYFGDNLPVLRDYVPDESVDLIYLDPPFNSNQTYNVLFKEKDGSAPAAQIKAFGDTWDWDTVARDTFAEILVSEHTPTRVSELMRSLVSALGRNKLTAYLVMMAIRLVELRRVLKPTGSIYLHCDPTASHYLKAVMDMVFDPRNFRNEIIWKRSSAHSDKAQGSKHHGRLHDVILFYTAGPQYTWNQQYTPLDPEYIESHYKQVDEHGRRFMWDNITGPGGAAKGNPLYEVLGVKGYWRYSMDRMDQLIAEGRVAIPPRGKTPRQKRYLDKSKGRPTQSIWADLPPINSQAKEALGYPTQKPEGLLERIILTSSNEGDTVLDPFCGCGTAVAVAQRLHRKWIGIDITHLAIALIRHRLADHYGEQIENEYEVHGVPADAEGARALAKGEDGRYQFQWWALELVGARPVGEGKKKGADKGIDGVILFCDEADATKVKRIIVSVKSGQVGYSDIVELRGIMEKEEAQMGFFVTLEPPTRPMHDAAVSAGSYETPFLGTHYPKIQILTIKDLLGGTKPERPPKSLGDLTFKRAPRAASGPAPIQGTL